MPRVGRAARGVNPCLHFAGSEPWSFETSSHRSATHPPHEARKIMCYAHPRFGTFAEEHRPPAAERRDRRAHALDSAAYGRVCQLAFYRWHLCLLENYVKRKKVCPGAPLLPAPRVFSGFREEPWPGGTLRHTRRAGRLFPPPWPLTVGVRCGIMSRAGLAGVILGAFSQGFRSPSRPALFSPVFPAGGRRISFAFSAPPKGERRKTKLNRPLPPWVLGLFFVLFSLGKTKLIQPPQEGRN